MANFDSLKLAVEGISGNKTTILMDNADLPSFMNPICKNTNAALFGGSEVVHSAFRQGTVEKDNFYISKFINCVVDGRAYSWPNVIPAHSYNFDAEMKFCTAKGEHWHQASFAEWAAIVHLMHKMGYEPRGNTNYGKSHSHTYEVGAKDSAGRTATGSGPVTWNHDGTSGGISDFVGNVWKRLSGMRLKNGQIQVMEGNAPALQVSHADASTAWKAIKVDGSLIDPDTTEETLHINASGNIGTSVVTTGANNKAFSAILAADSITLPEIIFELLLAPVSGITCHGHFWYNLEGERVPFRGGSCINTSHAGSAALYLSCSRSGVFGDIGFFSAYQE